MAFRLLRLNPNGSTELISDVILDEDLEFVGASAYTAGMKGNVPAPQAGQQDLFLKADGTWAKVDNSLHIGGVVHMSEYVSTDYGNDLPPISFILREDFLEPDEDGNLMPAEEPVSSAVFRLDEYGNIRTREFDTAMQYIHDTGYTLVNMFYKQFLSYNPSEE